MKVILSSPRSYSPHPWSLYHKWKRGKEKETAAPKL